MAGCIPDDIVEDPSQVEMRRDGILEIRCPKRLMCFAVAL